MTADHRTPDPEKQRRHYRETLVQSAGGYLRNVVRDAGITCSVCATFVEKPQYERCFPCRSQRDEFKHDLADLVVPLTYAVKNTQSGHLMYRYKSDRPGKMFDDARLLLISGLLQHGRCINARVGVDCSTRVTVPSLSGRLGTHPLGEMAIKLGLTNDQLVLTPTPGIIKMRTVQRGAFAVSDASQVQGRHAMVIDDTWASGGTAQSAALTVRQAGASHVTVLVLARWINLDHQPTAAVANENMTEDYDPLRCPVTGGVCP